MKPPPFTYHDPRTLADALRLAGSLDNAKLLAGGQSLAPMLNFRYVLPDHVVDLNRVTELSGLRIDGRRITVGAMTRQRALEKDEALAALCPIVREALAEVGHFQTRNRGTLGGSLAHLDPQSLPEAQQIRGRRDEPAGRAARTGVGACDDERPGAVEVGLVEARRLEAEGREDTLGQGVLEARPTPNGRQMPREPVPRVGVRPDLVAADEPGHRRELLDGRRERAVTVAETREISARQLAVEPGHVREQMTYVHLGRPDAGGLVEVEQPAGQQRRKRLRDRRGAEPRVAVAAERDH